MNFSARRHLCGLRSSSTLVVALLLALGPQTGFAQTNLALQSGPIFSPFNQSVAAAAAGDDAVSGYYRDSGYTPIWTAEGQEARRAALLSALDGATAHGLPKGRYDPQALIAQMHAARTEGDRGRLEVRMTQALLDYARDVQTGALEPGKVIPEIKREVPLRDRRANLDRFLASEPNAFLHSLPPRAPAYAQLMKAKLGLEARIASGRGWGPAVPARSLRPGDTGPAVIALRDRLIAMGYLPRTAAATYDAALQRAVLGYQTDQGLDPSGIATATTLAQINIAPEERLKSIIVALERERWMNIERGDRHIWVNLTDFTAKLMDHGKITFRTRSVIGKNDADRRTPEFSDVMEYMVINPTWNVPHSITTKEYLPMMQRNPGAAGHLKIYDRNGRVVPRGSVNFAAYTARNFPYSMKQPPSNSNALGLVKFMFPNPYNIYLHDTPSKSLFNEEKRDFSHGCIRLGDPFDFAYALLALQTDDPRGLFKSHLKTGSESSVQLEVPVPVHLVYFTAYPTTKGHIGYRNDVYGRDAVIFDALTRAGVVLGAQDS